MKIRPDAPGVARARLGWKARMEHEKLRLLGRRSLRGLIDAARSGRAAAGGGAG